MTEPEIARKVAAHRLLATAPADEVAWVLAHGTLRTFAPGQIMTRRSAENVEGIYFVLAGHLTISVDRGAGPHKVLEWRGGDTAGILPYSRMTTPPGDVTAEAPTEVFLIRRQDFPEMIRSCHEIISKLVHVMVDRARQFTTSDLHDEKMVSLGRLAAGLAHELNNPASALARGAKLLPERLVSSEAASIALGAAGLSEGDRAAIDEIRDLCACTPVNRVRSPLEDADRESTLADWLKDHGADEALAEPLAESAATLEALDRLASVLDGAKLEAALQWVAAGCATRALARELEEAAVRISDLVGSVKGFTQMDQVGITEPIDIGLGLRQTLAVIQAKARGKSISVEVVAEPNLPRVRGVAGELNQVWLNLIDNALDAAPESGRVTIRADHADGKVRVSVIDNGGGIPPEIQKRIFEPFFTTKGVGQGPGLGLGLSRRLVRKHIGEMAVESAPGRTEFRVTLPVLADTEAGGP
ncbi:MAG TPA: ATP-binding protein [Candidatus Eisenbacteria bacterium]